MKEVKTLYPQMPSQSPQNSAYVLLHGKWYDQILIFSWDKSDSKINLPDFVKWNYLEVQSEFSISGLLMSV